MFGSSSLSGSGSTSPGLKKSSSRLSLKKMGSQIFSKGLPRGSESALDTKRPTVIPLESTKVSPDDLKWALEPSSSTEAQTWYMTLDSGIFMFVQAVYSTMNSWSPSVQLTVRIYKPDGTEKTKAVSLGGGSFKVSEDKLSVDCEPIFVKYLPDTMGYHVKFDSGSECTLDFTFEPVGGYFKVNDGKVLFTSDPAGGYVVAQFLPRANITGKIVVDGVESSAKGLGLYLHAIQNKPQCVGKWNFIDFHGEKDSFMLYEFEMPPDAGYAFNIVSIGSFVRDGHILAISTNNRAVHLKKEFDDFSGYDIPTEVQLIWEGETTEPVPREFKAEVTAPLANLAAKIDVLSELPFLLRKFIQTFITAPFLYQWLENATIKVKIGEEVTESTGRMLVECSWLMAM